MPSLDNVVENKVAPKESPDMEKTNKEFQEKAVHCPICQSHIRIDYKVVDMNKTRVAWNHCYCGTIFHTQGLDRSLFNEEYLDKWKKMKEIDDRFDYLYRCYFSSIENIVAEQTYGRKFLDVGFTLPVIIEKLKEKGWISTGIDLIKNDYITDDFMTFEFKEKFDCILMGHVLESLSDPIAALEKAFDMIDDMGCLVLTTPCPELIRKTGPREFGHFANYKEKHVFLPRNVIKAVADRCGFTELLYIRNECRRFTMWNDAHFIFQKRMPY